MGKKTFALHLRGRTVLKLDREHQEFLLEVRPDTFSKCPVATGYWSYVELDRLDDAELADLVREAWSTIVPKKVSRPILEAAKVLEAAKGPATRPSSCARRPR